MSSQLFVTGEIGYQRSFTRTAVKNAEDAFSFDLDLSYVQLAWAPACGSDGGWHRGGGRDIVKGMRLLVLAILVGCLLAPRAAEADSRPLYYERALTAADLEGRTLRELTLMRNTIYARAGHTFRKKWLRDYFTAQAWYKPLAKDDNSKVTKLDRANASAIARAEEGQKRADLKKRRDDILARQRAGKATAEDDVELGLLNTRLGQWVAAEAEAKPPADVSPLEDPSQLDHVIKVEQLSNLSRRDLRILRNTIYARHGRQFKSKLLQAYFDTMEWYKPDPGFTDKRLNKVDTTNVRLIKSVEDTLGGPMSEDEQRAEEDMSGF